MPDYLRRASGESIYKAPGARLYATEAQLTLEQRIIAQAQSEAAPYLSPERSAELLGADQRELEDQLLGLSQSQEMITSSSLRADQAAVLHNLLTQSSPGRGRSGDRGLRARPTWPDVRPTSGRLRAGAA